MFASATTLKASLISKASIASFSTPACWSAFGTARLGAVVNLLGFCSASPQPRILARGVKLCDFMKSSDTRTTAEAPSERGEALGAVTVPEPSNLKAGFMPLSFSTLRGISAFSSLETTVAGLPRGPGTETGAISGAKRPSLVAFWAFWMVRMAYSSWAARSKPWSLAHSSPWRPMCSFE